MGIAAHIVHLLALLGVVLTYADWARATYPQFFGADAVFAIFAAPYALGLLSLQFPPWEEKGKTTRLVAALGMAGSVVAILQALFGLALVLVLAPDLPTPWLKAGGCAIAIPAAWIAARTSWRSWRRGPHAAYEVAPSPTGWRAKVDSVLGDDVIATVIAVGFVALFALLFWTRPNLRTQPKLIAGGAFFAFCAGVGLCTAMTSRLVQRALRGVAPGPQAVRLETGIAFARGFALVLGLYLLSLMVTLEAAGYHAAVGAILVLFALYPLLARRRYAATEAGIVERHGRGTTTYRWNEIAAVDVMILGGATSVLVALKDPDGSLARTEFRAQLGGGAQDLAWIQQRRAKMAKSLARAGHHLMIAATAADPSLPDFVATSSRFISRFGF